MIKTISASLLSLFALAGIAFAGDCDEKCKGKKGSDPAVACVEACDDLAKKCDDKCKDKDSDEPALAGCDKCKDKAKDTQDDEPALAGDCKDKCKEKDCDEPAAV